MKKLLILPILVFVLFACSSSDDDKTYLSVDKTEITFDGYQNEDVIIHVSSSFAWSVSVEHENQYSQSWIFTDKYIGDAGETTLTLKDVKINEGEKRECTVRLTNGDHREAIIKVTQLPTSESKPYFVSELEVLKIGISDAKVDLKITTNLEWNITDYPSWVQVSQISGSKSTTLTLAAKENYEYCRVLNNRYRFIG